MKPNNSQISQTLGYPPDAHLLIVNADDFGMCQSINAAIIQTLSAGLVRSTSLMVPCPAAPEAMRFLAEHSEIPFAVHLTASSNSLHNRWRPLLPPDQAPSLVDQTGYFYTFDHMQEFLAQVNLDDLVREFRAQIETALAAGLHPSHLDWHALRISGRADILDRIIELAKEYGLAMRVMGRPLIEKLQSQGLPTSNYDFLDSSSIDPAAQPARYAELLRKLPPGLSEWAVHPGLDGPELRAIEPTGNGFRQVDFDFWVSRQAKDLIEEEGILLLNYRPLQGFWRS